MSSLPLPGVVLTLGLFFTSILYSEVSRSQGAKELFHDYSDRIYQIRIIELSSDKQAAIGSGFQISKDGLVISNFHVIAEYAHNPQRYRIEYVNNLGEQADLQLINIDVINDLALLKIDKPVTGSIEVASQLPANGEAIYSLGNPHDLGLTVVPGTFNGITSYSIYERIHVSGALNAGMSGGPTLNAQGEVIGVNVASSGNQIGFLVPLHRLQKFINTSGEIPISSEAIESTIGEQLHNNQTKVIDNLLAQEWSLSHFGNTLIPNEIANHIRCWGYTDKGENIKYKHATSYCRDDDSIFISGQFSSGVILYRFDWFETEQLNRFQFYNMLENKITNASADNRAGEEDVRDYICNNDFVKGDASGQSLITTKVAYCAREYKKYPGLFDVFYIGVSAHLNNKSLISYFTLSGVSEPKATAFADKFMTSITWN